MNYDYSGYDPDDETGKAVRLSPPDVGEATATGRISMNGAAFQAFVNDRDEIWTSARHAGTLAAMGFDRILISGQTVNIAGIAFSYDSDEAENTVTVSCTVKTRERMRAESPVLLGCGCALISIMDRLRLMDRGIKIDSLTLDAK